MSSQPLPPGFEVVSVEDARATAALESYVTELVARFPAGFVGDSARTDPADYSPPLGCFVINVAGGEVSACGGLRHLDAERSEIKRMWVSPSVRGQGMAGRLLAVLEDLARAAGRRSVVLDTNDTLVEALRLYRRLGYLEIDPYNDNFAYATHWFAKEL